MPSKKDNSINTKYVLLLFFTFSSNIYCIIISLAVVALFFLFFKKIGTIPRLIQFAMITIITTNLLLTFFFYPKLLEYQLGNSVTKYINTKKIDKKNFYLYKIYGERSLDFYSNYSFQIIEDEKALKPADYLLISKKFN